MEEKEKLNLIAVLIGFFIGLVAYAIYLRWF